MVVEAQKIGVGVGSTEGRGWWWKLAAVEIFEGMGNGGDDW